MNLKNTIYNRARLFKILSVGKHSMRIDIYEIKNKGKSSFETFVENKLQSINIHKPINSCEKDMVKVYNSCRVEVLHKYFPMLNSDDIGGIIEGKSFTEEKYKKVCSTREKPG